MKEIKKQTKAQRLANPVWLRQQIAELVADSDDSASVRIHQHWKKQLERILAGKTSADAHGDTLTEPGVSCGQMATDPRPRLREQRSRAA